MSDQQEGQPPHLDSPPAPVVSAPDLPAPEMEMPPSDPDDGPGVGKEYPPDPPMPEE